MTNTETDYLARWISEFPNQKWFITNPHMEGWFRSNPCPNVYYSVSEEEWIRLIRLLRESEK